MLSMVKMPKVGRDLGHEKKGQGSVSADFAPRPRRSSRYFSFFYSLPI